MTLRVFRPAALVLSAAALLTACGTSSAPRNLSPTTPLVATEAQGTNVPDYLIGPYDDLEIFVWGADDLSTEVTVRPDGKISTPLVSDMVAAGKTPTELGQDLSRRLEEYVKQPEVTVIVAGFQSTFDQQIRVLGEAQQPKALPYQAGMTVLDVMLQVGGLTEFAAGNRAKIIRGRGDTQESVKVRLADLLRRGDVSANMDLRPGDVILIPETLF